MAIFRGTIESQALQMDTNLVVILPYDRPAAEQQYPSKVIYLLHGLSDNSEAWVRYTSIERYARAHGYAVIMPEVNRSFYMDLKYGLDYFTYVSEELPAVCETMFHLSSEREDTYIAGLSMGGYGAMKCALTFPERYQGAASFSGALDMQTVLALSDELEREHEFIAALGPDLALGAENDLMVLAEELTAVPSADRPKLFMTCGKQDFIYDSSVVFSQKLDELVVDYTFLQWDGEHEWGFWDKSVKMALDFFEDIPLDYE